jgi:hypothetical protein
VICATLLGDYISIEDKQHGVTAVANYGATNTVYLTINLHGMVSRT